MKTENQVLQRLEQAVGTLEQLNSQVPAGKEPRDLPAELHEELISATAALVVLAWVLDLEDEVRKSIAVCKAESALEQLGTKEEVK